MFYIILSISTISMYIIPSLSEHPLLPQSGGLSADVGDMPRAVAFVLLKLQPHAPPTPYPSDGWLSFFPTCQLLLTLYRFYGSMQYSAPFCRNIYFFTNLDCILSSILLLSNIKVLPV